MTTMVRVDYHEYLASREWALKKRAVFQRSAGRCERCHIFKHTQTHHLTYERIGHEELTDLQGLCDGCHAFVSAKSDVDPKVEFDAFLSSLRVQFQNNVVAGFQDYALRLWSVPEQYAVFNGCIQYFIETLEISEPATALRLSLIKFDANKRFYRDRQDVQ